MQESNQYSKTDGGPPKDPAFAKEKEQSDNASTEDINQCCGKLAHYSNRPIGGSHLFVAALKALRNLDKVRDFGEFISTHNEPQSIAPFPNLLIATLIDKSMIGPTARTNLLGLFHQIISIQVNGPVIKGSRLGNCASGISRKSGSGLIFWNFLNKPVGLACRGETDLCLVCLLLPVMAYAPGVRRIKSLFKDPIESFFAASL